MFSKCSEFVRNATMLFFCSELYLRLLAILGNYATQSGSADATAPAQARSHAAPAAVTGVAVPTRFAGLLPLEPYIPTAESFILKRLICPMFYAYSFTLSCGGGGWNNTCRKNTANMNYIPESKGGLHNVSATEKGGGWVHNTG